MEPELKAALDGLGTAIAGAEARLTTELERVESSLRAEIGRVESSLTAEIGRVESSLTEEIGHVESSLRAEIGGVESSLTAEIGGVESSLRAEIGRVESSLTMRIDGVDCKIDRVETGLRALIEQDVIPKIELVAEGVASARDQAERRLHEELGVLGPRTIVTEAAIADMLRRLERLEERTR